MHARILLLIALILSAFAAGCGDDSDDGESSDGENSAKFVTYNVGLATGFVAHAEERRDPIAAAIAASDADVICLQEVWTSDSGDGTWNQNYIDAILDATKEKYPHSFYERTTSDETISGACGAEEAQALGDCAIPACSDAEDLVGCVVANCPTEFTTLSGSCQACAGANLSLPIPEIISVCTEAEGAAFSYNGHNGLLLLSKHPFNSTAHHALDATLVKRSLLHAEVAIPEFGNTDVLCTHLAADLTGIVNYDPESSDYDSYEAEQGAQIDALLAFADANASTGSIVIAGDMNTGPATNGLAAELQGNYDKFGAAGYSAPYAEGSPECTYCGANDLNVDDTDDQLIDHIFLKFDGEYTVDSAAREFASEKTTVTDDDGATLDKHISDHYGVSATVSK